jgi:hypothetical protein
MKGSRDEWLLLAAAGCLLVLVLLIEWPSLWSSDEPVERLSGQSSEQVLPAFASVRVGPGWDALDDGSGGLAKLPVEEVFPDYLRSPDAGRVKLTLLGVREDARCVDAFWGKAVIGMLGNGGCVRTIRALYQDSGNQVVGMLAIVSMRDEAAAVRLARGIGDEPREGFLRSLQGAGGLRIREGFSFASTEARGSHVFVAWTQRFDRTGEISPTRGIPAEIGDASTALVTGGLRLAISLRDSG